MASKPTGPVATKAALAAMAAFAAAVVAFPAASSAVAGQTFTVNSTADPGTGSCDAVECTLREAITAANSSTGTTDTIAFAIPGLGVQTIQPHSALPAITDPVVIDATTQTGYAGQPLVEVDGSLAGNPANGLTIHAGGSTIEGLAINRFLHGDAIVVENAGGNTIEGNYIGTDATGSFDYGNDYGVGVSTPNNTISGNVISGNEQDGISIGLSTATGNLVEGNLIGTDATGTTALVNKRGVFISEGASNNTVGGTTDAARNVISGNGVEGVGGGVAVGSLAGSGNRIEGNYIGTDGSGSSGIPNSGFGVVIDTPGETVGGTSAGAGNLIAFNGGPGVWLPSYSTATGNAIESNSISGNNGLGIEIGPGGVTPNDPGDSDNGPNNLQNFPVLISMGSSDGSARINGMLNSAANTTYRVEFFSNSSCDPSGNGEGETYLGSHDETTDAAGNARFSVTFPVELGATDVVTATATDPGGNTSEFSTCRARSAALEVRKRLLPSIDSGRFDLALKDATGTNTLASASNVGDGGTTGPRTLSAGTYQVGETAEPGTNPSAYSSGVSCVDGNTPVAGAAGGGPLSVTIADGDDVVCTITNALPRSIAFASNRIGSQQIWLMYRDGEVPVQLTHDGATDKQPAWSPDGTKIAWASDASGNFDIWVANADGSSARDITLGANADDIQPTWSPDGTRIAFTRFGGGTGADGNVWVVNSDGSSPIALTGPGSPFIPKSKKRNPSCSIGSQLGCAPAWSPTANSTRIAFQSNQGGGFNVWTIDGWSLSAGGTEAKLTSINSSNESPHWNPAGTTIAFQSIQPATKTAPAQFEIYTTPFPCGGGCKPTRLTSNTAADTEPAFSADGAKVVFQSTRDDVSGEIYTIGATAANQTNATRLTANTFADVDPNWTFAAGAG